MNCQFGLWLGYCNFEIVQFVVLSIEKHFSIKSRILKFSLLLVDSTQQIQRSPESQQKDWKWISYHKISSIAEDFCDCDEKWIKGFFFISLDSRLEQFFSLRNSFSQPSSTALSLWGENSNERLRDDNIRQFPTISFLPRWNISFHNPHKSFREWSWMWYICFVYGSS